MKKISFTEEQVFLGKIAWGVCQDWARENTDADNTWFRGWEELSLSEQDRHVRMSESLVSYFRVIEGNGVLREDLDRVKGEYEKLRLQFQKMRKETVGA